MFDGPSEWKPRLRAFVPHARLFAGARIQLFISPASWNRLDMTYARVLLTFVDGTQVNARLERRTDGLTVTLTVDGYHLASGSPQGRRTWSLARLAADENVEFTVRAR
jgi:hypothetical protein